MLVLLSGIGPVIAWRRATLANVRRNFLWPGVAAAWPARRRARRSAPRIGVTAGVMFVAAAFTVAVVAQEFWRGVGARRAMTSEEPGARARQPRAAQPPALRRLHRPRRHGRAVRRRRRLVGLPARARRAPAARADRVRRRLRRPLRQADRARRRARARGRADRARRRRSRSAATDGSSRRCAPSAATTRRRRRSRRGASSGALRGRGDQRGRAEGGACCVTSGRSIQPDPDSLNKVISALADKTIEQAGRPAAARGRGAAQRLRSAASSPRQFRLLVSPLVTWIWVGGLIVFARRADRDVAGARRRPAARHRGLRGARGTGARPRLSVCDVLAPLLVIARARPRRLARQRAAARGRGGARTSATGAAAPGPRGRQGGQVPRDPRRRARLPHGQALRGRLAGARPRAARRGDGDPAATRRVSG